MSTVFKMCFQLALLWLSALACGRHLNDEHAKPAEQNGTSTSNSPKTPTVGQDAFGKRSYGFRSTEDTYPNGYSSAESDPRMPTDSSKHRPQHVRGADADDYIVPGNTRRLNEPEGMDSSERFNAGTGKLKGPEDDDNSYERVKVVKEIISLKPKERNKVLDPINDMQGDAHKQIVRPMRDVSIVIRNRHLTPMLVTHRIPARIIPRRPFYYYPNLPRRPQAPVKPEHSPKCKPCGPKVHKRKPRGRKPKKPKRKPKHKGRRGHEGNCKHKPKKPHHKKLLYYAPMPKAVMYNYGSKMPLKMSKPNTNPNHYNVKESPENEDVESDTEKPFQQDAEDDMDEHKFEDMTDIGGPTGDIGEPMGETGESFDDDEPSESKTM